MKRLAILGSTGSIGRQGLEVAARHPDRLEVVALGAGSDLNGLCDQARRMKPRGVALERAADVESARAALQAAAPTARVEIGPGAATRLIEGVPCDQVLNGIVGAAGLAPSLAALDAKARLALANKETLVVGGALIQGALARGGELIPVDSEHSAALQCLGGRPTAEVARLTLTASGGPLRRHPSWRNATPAEVLAHPVWAMGPRITVDSALLFNKGLELIEARWLFALSWPQLAAVLHPQARVHAMVEFIDGSVIAQAGAPDMRLPIQLALSWPERWPDESLPRLEHPLEALEFEPIVPGRFPAFELAVAAGREGGTAPCVVNAADEVAVQAFLDGAISLGQVPEVIARVLGAHETKTVESLAQLQEVDAWARAEARGQAVRV
ncbi:MAG TPA: 1-deoxy-D-xylulose-5-phosphate reductoisomerase [Candidatus Eisenbacteria bacterium]|nr:1-deoxy-D-xylulose-5-phosphate reductoisomerase [Candidatus Eisenbacteria bacterium]